MTLKDLNLKTIKEISNNELLNLHYRVHQLYTIAKKRKEVSEKFVNMLLHYHKIIEREMIKRNMKHKTPLVESFLEIFLDKLSKE